MTTPVRTRYAGYRFPAEIIGHAVWLYFRFPLGLRMVEELLAARGIIVSHETVRQWARKFGQPFANQIQGPARGGGLSSTSNLGRTPQRERGGGNLMSATSTKEKVADLVATFKSTGRLVIVGASLAGLRAAEALRKEGFTGPLTIIGDEPEEPYDRPPLSKQVLKGWY